MVVLVVVVVVVVVVCLPVCLSVWFHQTAQANATTGYCEMALACCPLCRYHCVNFDELMQHDCTRSAQVLTEIDVWLEDDQIDERVSDRGPNPDAESQVEHAPGGDVPRSDVTCSEAMFPVEYAPGVAISGSDVTGNVPIRLSTMSTGAGVWPVGCQCVQCQVEQVRSRSEMGSRVMWEFGRTCFESPRRG